MSVLEKNIEAEIKRLTLLLDGVVNSNSEAERVASKEFGAVKPHGGVNLLLTGAETQTAMLACKLSAELADSNSAIKYEDLYKVLLSQYVPQMK